MILHCLLRPEQLCVNNLCLHLFLFITVVDFDRSGYPRYRPRSADIFTVKHEDSNFFGGFCNCLPAW